MKSKGDQVHSATSQLRTALGPDATKAGSLGAVTLSYGSVAITCLTACGLTGGPGGGHMGMCISQSTNANLADVAATAKEAKSDISPYPCMASVQAVGHALQKSQQLASSSPSTPAPATASSTCSATPSTSRTPRAASS